MRYRSAAVVVAAVAAAGVFALAPSAGAVNAPGGPGASAHAPVRTVVDTWSFQFNGYRDETGWYYRAAYKASAVRSPKLAISETFRDAYFVRGKPATYHGLAILAGRVWYEKYNGATKWTRKGASAKTLEQNAASTNPYNTLAKVLAIHAVALVAPGHYRVTCPASQANAFLTGDFGETAKNLTQNGIKTVTINFWVDSLGRPVKDTVTGQSSDVRLSATETFTKYNAPLTITAP